MLTRYAARNARTSLLADLSLFKALVTSSSMDLVSAEGVSSRWEDAYSEPGRDAPSTGTISSDLGDTPSSREDGIESGKSIL